MNTSNITKTSFCGNPTSSELDAGSNYSSGYVNDIVASPSASSTSSSLGSLWYVGLILSVVSSITTNTGIGLQKLSMMKEEDRDAEKQRPYICQPMWDAGLVLQITGSIGDFAALAFAPQSLCAPVGGCTIVANLAMAEIWLGEKMSKLDYVATCIVGSGVILSAYFADKSEQCFELFDLMDLYVTPSFLAYGSCVILVLIILYVLVSRYESIRDKFGKHSDEYMKVIKLHRFFVPLFSSLIGSQSIIFAKSIAELLKMTARGNNQFIFWETYLLMISMVITIFTQIHWLAKGLKYFDAVYCIPIFQAGFITFASFGGGIYFQEFWNFNLDQMIGFPISIGLIGAGVFLLSFREVTPVGDKVELLDAIAEEEASHIMTDVDDDQEYKDSNSAIDSGSPSRKSVSLKMRTLPVRFKRSATEGSPSRGGPTAGRRLSVPVGTPKAWIQNGLQNGGNGVSILYAAREIKRHLGGRRRSRRGVGPSLNGDTSPREHMSVSSVTSVEFDTDDVGGVRGGSSSSSVGTGTLDKAEEHKKRLQLKLKEQEGGGDMHIPRRSSSPARSNIYRANDDDDDDDDDDNDTGGGGNCEQEKGSTFDSTQEVNMSHLRNSLDSAISTSELNFGDC